MQTLRKTHCALLLLLLLVAFSCGEEEPVAVQQESVNFSIELPDLGESDGRTAGQIPSGSRVLIELLTPTGTIKEELEILQFGESHITEPLQLSTGAHKVTSFLVVNDEYKVMFASPKEQSTYATVVSNALPYSFNVHKGKVKNLAIQVLDVAGKGAPDFGYASFVVDGQPEVTINVMLFEHQARRYLTFSFSEPGSIQVDWGDGIVENINFVASTYQTYYHTPASGSPRLTTITLRGDLDEITNFVPAGIISADLKALVNLKEFYLTEPVETLDLTNQYALETIFTAGTVQDLKLGDNKIHLDDFHLTLYSALPDAMLTEIERHIRASDVRGGSLVFWETTLTPAQVTRLRVIADEYDWYISNGFTEI
jgi:hypothetical protein